jgi:hypothetical protein
VKNFLQNEALKYNSITVEWIGGRAPELFFLDKHKRVVSTHDLSPFDEEQIHQLLNQNGIFTHTPAPTYAAPSFAPTANCVAWRQTGDCDPAGPREELADESCGTTITNGRSGYCECRGKPNLEYVCDHAEFTCDSVCEGGSDDTADEHPPAEEDDEHAEF